MYGEAQLSERHKTWSLLKFIKSSSSLPWVCIGDFNLVLHQSEHVAFKKGAELGLRDSERWLMYVALVTLVLRAAVGLLKTR